MSDDRHTGPEDDVLAAEYVLGVLDADARVLARRRIAAEPEFSGMVAMWEQRLASMSDAYAPAAPPPHVKATVEARLFAQEAQEAPGPERFWNRIGFWRPLAIVASLLFILSTGFGLWNGVFLPPPSGNLVVSLQPNNSPVSFVAVYQPGSDTVRLSPVSGEADADKDFELWLIEGDNPAISLGVLPKSGNARISLPQDLARKFVAGTTLAVSLEPAGGSPTGVATGPIVAVGTAKSI